ncbi:MAG: hypothetical protein KKE16_00795 [Firmicutes bacterium]|nr:hypothetical protein [Bacillota bacterium]
MNYIEKFNYDLNTSASIRFESWKEYRAQIMSFIKIHVSKKVDRLLVIGCGSGNDLNLAELKEWTKQLIITDVDFISMNRSLDQYQMTEDQVIIKRAEYSGFESIRFFDTFMKDVLEINDKESLIAYLESKLNSLQDYRFLEEEFNHNDIVIISPLFTQLAYSQVSDYCEMLLNLHYSPVLTKVIKDTLIDMMPNIIDRFNQNVLDFLKKDGQLIVLSDIFEYSIPSIFGSQIERNISYPDKMNAIYDKYKEKYGMGLGDYGLWSLEQISKKNREAWLIWPFDEKRKFAVKAVSFKINK